MTITKSGELASFYTVNKAPIKHLRVYFSPKQAGEGNPSPENIREITGYNEIELNYTNEVLFEIPSGKYTWIVPECYKGKTILYSGYVDNTNGTKDAKLSFRFYDKENATISTGTSLDYVPIGGKKVINVLFTLTDDINSVVFNMSVSSTAIVGTRQVILSSNIISNKIYYNQNKTIDWSNTIGTIYGGYIDLITGELVQTHAKYIENGTINTNTWYSLRMSSSLIYVFKSLAYLENLQPKLGHQAGIFNYLTSPLSGNSWRGAIGTNANTKNNTPANNDLRIIIASADFPNISDFISYLNEHPLEFVYELETPITHQLTSAQLQTFIGQNNIWSNADRVEVEYDLAESNDELYRRRNIILQSAPHLESASGNIVNFNTDLVAPIKDAKIYFEPIQEGSGNPSPENIRNIVGFTKINTYKASKNLLNPAYYSSSNTYESNGITFTHDGNGIITMNGTSNGEKSAQVTFSWTQPFDCDYYFCGNTSFGSSVGDVYIWDLTTGARPTQWDGITACKSSNVALQEVKLLAGHHIQFCVRVYYINTTTLVNATAKPVLVHKTCTDRTFKPYQGNTIPITFPTTKNLFDEQFTGIVSQLTYHSLYVGDGNITASTTTPQSETQGYSNIFIFPGQVTSGASTGRNDICLGRTRTVTPIDGYITIAYRNEYGVDPTQYHTQIEKGDVATFYEPYGTFYGGYVDLINNEIVETWHSITADGINIKANSQYIRNNTKIGGGIVYVSPYGNHQSDSLFNTTVLCNKLPTVSQQGQNLTEPYLWCARNGMLFVVFYLWNASDFETTPTKQETINATNAWLQENPVTIVYKLNTPIHHQLTLQQLKTFKGVNNIWSDSNGTVNIKYWTH